MSALVSLVYLTYRTDPRFDWFADSLSRQIDGDEVEVILVDGRHSPDRTAHFTSQVGGRFAFRHVAAKPTPYAGPNRRTTRDFFTASSARNTGVVWARAPYVVCADDLSVLMPGWWAAVRQAAAQGVVVAGAYEKRREMHVNEGILRSSVRTPSGVDSRWAMGRDGDTVRAAGSQLFGCSFGAPRQLLADVNGCDELCDSIGGEDSHLGVRLEWAGATIRYARSMLTIESSELHHSDPPAVRIDKSTIPSEYMRRLRDFGVHRRACDGAWDSSHMMLDILYGTRSTQTQGNYYLLSTLTPESFDRLPARFPSSYWFDCQAFAAL